MTEALRCYQCGASLEKLSLPLMREDQCPECAVYLHCCRMCSDYDPAVAKQCREDDAEEIKEKARANFCDWFRPNAAAFDPARAKAASDAARALDALFGGGDAPDPGDDPARKAAEDLFR